MEVVRASAHPSHIHEAEPGTIARPEDVMLPLFAAAHTYLVMPLRSGDPSNALEGAPFSRYRVAMRTFRPCPCPAPRYLMRARLPVSFSAFRRSRL